MARRTEEQKRRDRERYANDPEWRAKRVQESNERNKKRRKRRRAQVIEHYGGACACCGETFEPFLCVDHVGGDGAAHRKVVKAVALYKWLIDNGFPDGLRILCWNCNSTLHIHGECKPGHRFGGQLDKQARVEYDARRGEVYSDGGVTGAGRVFYPDRERIDRMHREWTDV